MLFLQPHHIVDLYCWIDTIVERDVPAKTGRPQKLVVTEVITVLVWNALVLRQKTLKDLHTFVGMYHQEDFPTLPKYSSFVDHCHRALPRCIELLGQLLETKAPVRLMDATMLPVCKLERASQHKVAQTIANFGKNHQGWHYGFKLHASMTPQGVLSQITFTPANVYDAQVMPQILNEHCQVACGDTLYGARVMGRKIWQQYGTVIIAPPFPKQRKKIATTWQSHLLSFRSKIESCFDYLKNHLNLVSSFPRSPQGFLLHYVRILLGYQILALHQAF